MHRKWWHLRWTCHFWNYQWHYWNFWLINLKNNFLWLHYIGRLLIWVHRFVISLPYWRMQHLSLRRIIIVSAASLIWISYSSSTFYSYIRCNNSWFWIGSGRLQRLQWILRVLVHHQSVIISWKRLQRDILLRNAEVTEAIITIIGWYAFVVGWSGIIQVSISILWVEADPKFLLALNLFSPLIIYTWWSWIIIVYFEFLWSLLQSRAIVLRTISSVSKQIEVLAIHLKFWT